MDPTSTIGVCALRISRALTNGTPDYGNPNGALVLCGGLSQFQYDWSVEEGEHVFEKDACNNPCVNVLRDPIIQYVSGSITFCKKHPFLDEILGASALTDGAETVGAGFEAAEGCAPSSLGPVIVELWEENYDCDELDANHPYIRNVLGKSKFWPGGHTKQNGVSLPVYNFRSQGNRNIGNGPFNDLNNLVTAAGAVDSMPLWDVFDTDLPDCPDPFDYVALPADVS